MNFKDNNKSKKPPDKKGDKSKSQEESSNSKKKKFQKKKGKAEGNKCTYCGKGFHPERSCMKKQIDMLNQLLEKKTCHFLKTQRRRKEDQVSKTRRELMPWLKAL